MGKSMPQIRWLKHNHVLDFCINETRQKTFKVQIDICWECITFNIEGVALFYEVIFDKQDLNIGKI